MGIPGGSNALAIASQLGLLPNIISTAREMLAKGTQEIEALLRDMMGEKQRMELCAAHWRRRQTKQEN
jgi:dsDNA-specific endonuclease/ATPase MutS2